MTQRKNVSYAVAHHVDDLWKKIDLRTDLQVAFGVQNEALVEIWHRVTSSHE